MIKPKVGDNFYLVGNSHRGYTNKNYDCTVSNVKIKYFTVTYITDQTQQGVFTQEVIFSIKDRKQKSDFRADFFLFDSKEFFEDHMLAQRWRKKFNKIFSHWNSKEYSSAQYEAAAEIFNIQLEGDDNA